MLNNKKVRHCRTAICDGWPESRCKKPLIGRLSYLMVLIPRIELGTPSLPRMLYRLSHISTLTGKDHAQCVI